jgi:hypothetical protein
MEFLLKLLIFIATYVVFGLIYMLVAAIWGANIGALGLTLYAGILHTIVFGRLVHKCDRTPSDPSSSR